MPYAHDVTRRTLLRGAALGPIAFASSIENVFGQRVSKPPNIVFIMADDLGYADVACYGRPDLNTPNIDRVAAKGVRFLQAYANSAVCSATRTALITGRYQYRLPLGLEEPLADSGFRSSQAATRVEPSNSAKVCVGVIATNPWMNKLNTHSVLRREVHRRIIQRKRLRSDN